MAFSSILPDQFSSWPEKFTVMLFRPCWHELKRGLFSTPIPSPYEVNFQNWSRKRAHFQLHVNKALWACRNKSDWMPGWKAIVESVRITFYSEFDTVRIWWKFTLKISNSDDFQFWQLPILTFSNYVIFLKVFDNFFCQFLFPVLILSNLRYFMPAQD